MEAAVSPLLFPDWLPQPLLTGSSLAYVPAAMIGRRLVLFSRSLSPAVLVRNRKFGESAVDASKAAEILTGLISIAWPLRKGLHVTPSGVIEPQFMHVARRRKKHRKAAGLEFVDSSRRPPQAFGKDWGYRDPEILSGAPLDASSLQKHHRWGGGVTDLHCLSPLESRAEDEECFSSGQLGLC